MKPSVNIAFLAPRYVSFDFVASLVDTVLELKVRGYRVLVSPKKSGPNIAPSRDALVKNFRDKTVCDYLLMVDSDMTFTADDVEAVITAAQARPGAVIGGVCKAQDDGDGFIVAWGDGADVPDEALVPEDAWDAVPWKNKPARVTYTGAAFLLIPRAVAITVGAEHGWWFMPTYRFRVQEDFAFCERLLAHKVPVYLAPAARIGHVKEIVLKAEGA